MVRRFGLLLVIVPMVMLVLVACGGDDDAAAPAPPPPAAEPAPPAAEPEPAASAASQPSGDDSTPTATFDGSACTYEGPTEFPLDSRVTFTFVNATDETVGGFFIWKVPDGTTVDDISEQGILTIANFIPDARGGVQQLIGTEVAVALDTPGTWAVNCYTTTDFPATVFTVTGS